MTERDREILDSIHEAGHAVVAVRLGVRLADPGLTMRNCTREPIIRHEDDAEGAEKAITISSAGAAAESVTSGTEVGVAGDDARNVLTASWAIDAAERHEASSRAQERAAILVRENWDAIEALASELRRRRAMSPAEVEAFVRPRLAP